MHFNEVASKAQSVLDFATHLQRLLDKDASLPPQTISDILPYIQALPLPRKDLAPDQRIEFDRAGVLLWNTCCKLGKSDEELDKKNLATIRAFSYFLVATAASSKGKSVIRLFKHALKASRSCLDASLFDIGSKIIEQLASKHEDLSQIKHEEGKIEEQVIKGLGSLYLLVRIALAWKQDRAELADHFYSQLQTAHPLNDSEIAGELIDLCYEIGNDQMHRNQSVEAIKWLERGCQLTDRYKSQLEGPEMDELRLSLLHTYVRALLSTQGAQPDQEVQGVLDVLHEEFGRKLCVSLLQLEVYAGESAPDIEGFAAELLNMIRIAHLIPANHKSIMHYIHHLKSFSVDHALKTLEIYITTRLVADEENTWTENTVLTLVWMMATATQEPTSVVLFEFQKTLDRVQQSWNDVLSPAATHAALIFIWKGIERTFEADAKEHTVQWCQLALHEMFKNAGDASVGKVERKMIQCHINLSKVDAARDIWEKMSPARKRHELSRYLQYCIALRRRDDTAVWSALTSLATVHDDRNRLLFTAVSEAMKHGTNAQTAQLLQRILERYKNGLPADVDAIILARCTARLLIRAIEEDDNPLDELLSRLCAVFKTASLIVQKHDTLQPRCASSILADCKWFEQASFSCAISNYKSWPARYVIDLLQYSRETQYPPDSSEESLIEKSLHEATTAFAQALLYTAEARSASTDWTIEDLPRSSYSSKSTPLQADIKKTLYRNVFDKYTDLYRRYNELQGEWPSATPTMQEDLDKKAVVIAPLAFEALLFLTSQENAAVDKSSLNQIIDQAIQLQPTMRQYSSLVDMALCAVRGVPDHGNKDEEEHSGPRLSIVAATQILAKLIQGVRSQSDYDTAEASRWIRCVVQVVLVGRSSDSRPTSPHDEKALKTLDMITQQALILARSSNGKDILRGPIQYPTEELEWLSTTLFNLSIDLYISQTEQTRAPEQSVGKSNNACTESTPNVTNPETWAAKAVEFADLLAGLTPLSEGQENEAIIEGTGGDMLARILRDRCQGLGWHV